MFLFLFISIFVSAEYVSTVDDGDVIIILLSQSNIYHEQKALSFKSHISKQSDVNVLLSHEAWPGIAAWSFFPIIKDLDSYAATWFMFCEEDTRIDIGKLKKFLDKYNDDQKKELVIGKGLRDSQATIIHHFAFANNIRSFSYPDIAAGVLINKQLIHSLALRISNDFKGDFVIDAKHELAKYIWNDGNGPKMIESDKFCTKISSHRCITTFENIFPNCGKTISSDDLFVAVKTCKKFHDVRIPVVQATWGKDAKHIEFYSELADPLIPTTDIGLPNVERGFCGKTFAIIDIFVHNSEKSAFNWLLLADDDTLISLPRLRKFLSCYDQDEPIVIGERYGYLVSRPRRQGYSYPTGGGGIVFNRKAASTIIKSCSCPRIDTPDDMYLGSCLNRLQIEMIHSPLFHQARPDDYSVDYLKHQTPISFHKHWMIDPISEYNKWFGDHLFHDEL